MHRATAPGSGERQRYDYASMTAEGVTAAADDALDEAERLIAGAVEMAAPRTYENTIRPLFEAARGIWRAEGVGPMIGYVHPDEAIRDAAGGVEERLDQWRSGLARRDELAAAIRATRRPRRHDHWRALGDGRSSCGCATSGAADTSWSRSQGRVRAAPRSCLRARRCVRAEPGRVVRRNRPRPGRPRRVRPASSRSSPRARHRARAD